MRLSWPETGQKLRTPVLFQLRNPSAGLPTRQFRKTALKIFQIRVSLMSHPQGLKNVLWVELIRGHSEIKFAPILEAKPFPKPPDLNLGAEMSDFLRHNNIEIWGKGGFLCGQGDVRELCPPTETVHWV